MRRSRSSTPCACGWAVDRRARRRDEDDNTGFACRHTCCLRRRTCFPYSRSKKSRRLRARSAAGRWRHPKTEHICRRRRNPSLSTSGHAPGDEYHRQRVPKTLQVASSESSAASGTKLSKRCIMRAWGCRFVVASGWRLSGDQRGGGGRPASSSDNSQITESCSARKSFPTSACRPSMFSTRRAPSLSLVTRSLGVDAAVVDAAAAAVAAADVAGAAAAAVAAAAVAAARHGDVASILLNGKPTTV